MTLLTLCVVATVSLAMPSHYDFNADVEVRAPPVTEAELLEARRMPGGGLGDVIVEVIATIKTGIAEDKLVCAVNYLLPTTTILN